MNSSIEMKSAAPAPAPGIAGNAPTYVARHARAGNDSLPAPDRAALRGYDRRSSAAEGGHALKPPPAAAVVSTQWPTDYELYLAARSHRAFVLGEILAAMVDEIAAATRRWIVRYREHRRAAAAREALRELDDRTLHDIGLDRSEIASVTAEWIGDAERSRLQLASRPLDRRTR
ncbi:MAG TPA: DUF1127 domain-containing protein [Casimicrobiaceae bacterium]|nr:DUF1127 domain-containing protein [Casimicrobiaceae bacterium]